MKEYETIIIFSMKRRDTRTLKENIDEMRDIFKRRTPDSLFKMEELGEKKLAYEVKGETTGYYVVFTWTGDAEDVAEAERQMRINDNILKFITIRTDKDEEDLEEFVDEADVKSEQDESKPKVDALDVLLGLAKYN